MFSIAICDDDKVVCSDIDSILEDYNSNFNIRIFHSGEQLLKYLVNNYVDLIFLDIEMSKLNGIDVGRKLRDEIQNFSTQIVYISSKESYAIHLFKVRTFDFLLKPIKSKDIINCLENLQRQIQKQIGCFEFQADGAYTKIPLNEILYFECNNRIVEIVTTKQNYSIYSKLYKIKDQIKSPDFVMVHRSYLVNFNFVQSYSYEEIIMVNGDRITISQANRSAVRTYFLENRGKQHVRI